MELSWHRFETHRSPKGHGFRASARGRRFEAWQDASGRWRVQSTDRPQDKPDFRSWPEAREWAEKRASANPAPERNPRSIHSPRGEGSRPMSTARPNPRRPISREDAKRLVSLHKGGSKAYRRQLVFLLAEDGSPQWSGTLDDFLKSNRDLDANEVIIDLVATGESHFGGGAAPMTTLRLQRADPTANSPKANPSKVDAHKANQLRLFIDGSSDLNSPTGNDRIVEERQEADERAFKILADSSSAGRAASFSDDTADHLYGALVERAYTVFVRRGGPKMTKPTRQYVARELGEDVQWEYKAVRGRSANPHTWKVVRSKKISSGHRHDYREWTLERDDGDEIYVTGSAGRYDKPARVAGQAWVELDQGPWGYMQTAASRRPIEDAIMEYEMDQKRLNPRGKHIACGSQIGAKDCRQLQHVYESQKARGLSDERAAKSAWGSLERNPATPEKVTRTWLAIRNPAKGKRGEVDEHAATELELWIDNTKPLHDQWVAIVKNLWKHQAKGRYNHERAVDGFMYVVDAGAKNYAKEFGGTWNEMFNSATRRHSAEEYADSFETNRRDEIYYAPASAKQNPRTKNASGLEIYDIRDLEREPTITSGHMHDLKIEEKVRGVPTRWWLSRMTVEDGETSAIYVEQLVDGRWTDVHQYGDPQEYSEMFEENPKRNPALAAFDKLSAHDQVEAIHAYARGLQIGSGAPAVTYTTVPKYNAFVAAGEHDAKVAISASRAGNPTPPQRAWVVIDRGKATGLFFAGDPLEYNAATQIPSGPSGRRRNGAGLGAFIGSVAGSVVGTAIAAVGAAPLATTAGLVIAPLSLLLSAAGGAVGGHMGAGSKSKKRGAIGGGVGGLFGPLGAALGGYLGGRKADKKSNPRERSIARRITA